MAVYLLIIYPFLLIFLKGSCEMGIFFFWVGNGYGSLKSQKSMVTHDIHIVTESEKKGVWLKSSLR